MNENWNNSNIFLRSNSGPLNIRLSVLHWVCTDACLNADSPLISCFWFATFIVLCAVCPQVVRCCYVCYRSWKCRGPASGRYRAGHRGTSHLHKASTIKVTISYSPFTTGGMGHSLMMPSFPPTKYHPPSPPLLHNMLSTTSGSPQMQYTK